MRTSHCVYQSSDVSRCLYNSVSLLLYGSDSHSAFLKLLSKSGKDKGRGQRAVLLKISRIISKIKLEVKHRNLLRS